MCHVTITQKWELARQGCGMEFDAFCKLWLSSKVEFGGWINHVKGWREEYLNSNSNILWMS